MKKFKTTGGAKSGVTELAPNSPTAKWLIGIDEVGRGPLAGPVAVCVCAMRIDNENMDARAVDQLLKHKTPKETYKKFLKKYEKEIKSRGLASLRGRDSKKLKEKERDAWYDFLVGVSDGECDSDCDGDGGSYGDSNSDGTKRSGADLLFFYDTASARDIDKKGIAVCIRQLIENNLNKFLSGVEKGGEKISGKALEKILPEEVHVLLDGSLYAPAHFSKQKTIIKGDEKELVISLASIYAKVTRDRYMKNVSKKSKYSMYGLEKHKGYGTKEHINSIKKHGPSDLHRKSFLKSILLKN